MDEGGQLLKKLRTRPAAIAAILLLIGMVCFAGIGPFFLPATYAETSANQFQAPSFAHPFGTDLNGRDLFLRVMQGARISILVGITGALISLIVGTAYGMISGYAGGKIDQFMMRFVDVLYSIPRLILILIAINAFDSRVVGLFEHENVIRFAGYSRVIIMIGCLGLMEWLTMARIVRGQVLALKTQPFVTAARSLGQSHTGILVLHLLPNLAGIILVYLTLAIPAVMMDESFLSFLGVGVDAPLASWGSLLSDGAQVINPVRSNWWLLVFPAVTMSITLLSLNILGDALRDVLDPRFRRS